MKHKCKKCNGTGFIEYYHDAGDHFGAGTSPFSEYRKIRCGRCNIGFNCKYYPCEDVYKYSDLFCMACSYEC